MYINRCPRLLNTRIYRTPVSASCEIRRYAATATLMIVIQRDPFRFVVIVFRPISNDLICYRFSVHFRTSELRKIPHCKTHCVEGRFRRKSSALILHGVPEIGNSGTADGTAYGVTVNHNIIILSISYE